MKLKKIEVLSRPYNKLTYQFKKMNKSPYQSYRSMGICINTISDLYHFTRQADLLDLYPQQ